MATPPRRPSLPATPESFRRSFTAPLPKLSPSPRPSYVDSTDASAEIIYSHPTTTTYSFSPPSVDPTSTRPASLDLDFPVDAIETLPWTAPRENLVARGLLLIEKVSGSTTFLKSGKFLHAILKNSQCWCVDGDSKFVLRRGPFRYYRLELPNTTEEDRKKIEELKVVLGRILRFEVTPCPFKRDFIVELPSDVSTPKKKRAWRPRQSSGLSSPLSMNSYEEWRESRRPSTAMSIRSMNTDADSVDESVCSRSESRAESYFDEQDETNEELPLKQEEQELTDNHSLRGEHSPALGSPKSQAQSPAELVSPAGLPSPGQGGLTGKEEILESDDNIGRIPEAAISTDPSMVQSVLQSTAESPREALDIPKAEHVHRDGEHEQGGVTEEVSASTSQRASSIVTSGDHSVVGSAEREDLSPLSMDSQGDSFHIDQSLDTLDPTEKDREELNSGPNITPGKAKLSTGDAEEIDGTLENSGLEAKASDDDLQGAEQQSDDVPSVEILPRDAATSQDISATRETPSSSEPIVDDSMNSNEWPTSFPHSSDPLPLDNENLELDSGLVRTSSQLSSSATSFSSMNSFHTTVPDLPPSPSYSNLSSPVRLDGVATDEVQAVETIQSHKRGLSEVTVTDIKSISDTASEPSEHPSTPKLTHDSSSEGDWPDVVTPAPVDGMRQRRMGKRSGFSPLPPASTLLTSSPRQNERHVTTAIVQKAVSVAVGKPLEAVILMLHVLGRIATGATVQDLMSGELFRQPERTPSHRRSTSLNEDDYGIPIRGRSRRRSLSPAKPAPESWHDLD